MQPSLNPFSAGLYQIPLRIVDDTIKNVYFLTQPFQPHVEVTLSTSNDTIIKAVLIFAEGIFEVLSSF